MLAEVELFFWGTTRMSRLLILLLVGLCLNACLRSSAIADDWKFELRYIVEKPEGQIRIEQRMRAETWPASETALIVCDVWDYHHCRNAVRRLEEFAPRLDAVLKEARRRGATIIHAPSDCMEAYAEHPARKRAISVPLAPKLPPDIQHWCSRIPAEEQAAYPIDQSDGGEDDDPREHAAWAAKLKALGRNPQMPWKRQSPLITIDGERDYISDRGEEVWSILEAEGIHSVILTGVHTNMCVLGRPFGLRQMVRNGKRVALMRDMTDCMYNPTRWPYVDHFTGNDLVIAHVERYICPTITSDQLLGGEPFQFQSDKRSQRNVLTLPKGQTDAAAFEKQWTLVAVPLTPENIAAADKGNGSGWLRCAVRLPKSWIAEGPLFLELGKQSNITGVWLNGRAATRNESASGSTYQMATADVAPDDANLLVIRTEAGNVGLSEPPVLVAGKQRMTLQGRWQMRLGEDPTWSNIPLPARFGAAPDILFEARQVK